MKQPSILTGADLNKDDGIYSAFFVSFKWDGRYAVKVLPIYHQIYCYWLFVIVRGESYICKCEVYTYPTFLKYINVVFVIFGIILKIF